MATVKKGADTGGVRGSCGKNGCTRYLYLKPNRLADNGKFYHPACLPKGKTFQVEGAIPKAITLEAWNTAERTLASKVAKRKAEREAAKKA